MGMFAGGYTVPDDPPDPEAAALELIVRLSACFSKDDNQAPGGGLQDFAGLLDAEGCFAGLTWNDAKARALRIAADVLDS